MVLCNILIFDFLKAFLSKTKNKGDAQNIVLSENVLSYDFGNVTANVALHDTVSGKRGSHIGSLEKGRRQEEADRKIILHVSDCLKNSHIIEVKLATYI